MTFIFFYVTKEGKLIILRIVKQVKLKPHAVIAPKVIQRFQDDLKKPLFVCQYNILVIISKLLNPKHLLQIRAHLFTCGRGAKYHILTLKLFSNDKWYTYLHSKYIFLKLEAIWSHDNLHIAFTADFPSHEKAIITFKKKRNPSLKE